jgi:hypothetical protein
MNRDILSYTVFLVFSLSFFALSFGIELTSVSPANSALFPKIILLFMAALSAVGLFNAFRDAQPTPVGKVHSPFYVVLGMIALYVLAFKFFGFVLSATAFIVTMAVYMSKNHTPKFIGAVLCGGLAASFGIRFLFMNILAFALP